jgi:hypothetical protein
MITSVLLDAAGRRRSPAAMPGHHCGRPPRNKGLRYPADPPTVEEIVAVMRVAGNTPYGLRARALIVILRRTGLRISEAVALAEAICIEPPAASWSVAARVASAAKSAWTAGAGSSSHPGSTCGRPCPSAPCCASSTALPAVVRGRHQPLARRSEAPPPALACVAFRPASASPCARGRDGTRGSPVDHHPAAARPREPRHHIHLPARHRQQRDHQHRLCAPGAHAAGQRRASLSDQRPQGRAAPATTGANRCRPCLDATASRSSGPRHF